MIRDTLRCFPCAPSRVSPRHPSLGLWWWSSSSFFIFIFLPSFLFLSFFLSSFFFFDNYINNMFFAFSSKISHAKHGPHRAISAREVPCCCRLCSWNKCGRCCFPTPSGRGRKGGSSPPSLILGGTAFHPPCFGGAAFLLLLLLGGAAFSASFGWWYRFLVEIKLNKFKFK